MSKHRSYKERPPAMHMRSASTLAGVDGLPIAVPLCVSNSWLMTDEWRSVSCRKCLARRKKDDERRQREKS